MGRDRDPRFQAFGPKYAALSGLTNNGREQDRQLLAELPREKYLEIAKDLQARLTDDVIEQAARRLPAEWYALDGARLARRGSGRGATPFRRSPRRSISSSPTSRTSTSPTSRS